ncbi:MAG: PKD domain-containing protein [Thermoplasmatota archaeon]
MRAWTALLALASLLAVAQPQTYLGGGDAGGAPRAALFVNATAEAGLAGVSGSFFAWGDYDRDGHQDLLVDGKRLFRSSGPPSWTFAEVTARAGIGGSGANTGCWADYDNDGLLDIYCPSGGWSTDFSPLWDILWRNRGDGTFENATDAAGHVTDTFPSVAAGWADYDRDGFVDIYVANYENSSMTSYYPDVLWRNRGDGTFENATAAAGVWEGEEPRPGRGVSWCDFDNDGWADIYVCNYRLRANYLYRNNRDGTFTDVAEERGVEGEPTTRLGQTYYGHSVGSAWSDIDNDGDFDLWVSNLAHKDLYRGPICDDSELYRSGGAGGGYIFESARAGSGIPVKRVGGGEDELFVGCAWGDYDCDGYEDLFIPQIYDDVPYAYSLLFHNNGNGTFTDVTLEAGVRVWDTYGGCWCDYDEDGDLDLVTGGKGEEAAGAPHETHLFKSTLNDAGGATWLEIDLEGTRSNAAAIGARVLASAGGATQMREVQGGMGAHSMQNSMRLHFGFPRSPASADIKVIWPDGSSQELGAVALNRVLKVVERSDRLPDLEVERLSLSTAAPVEGDVVTVSAAVRNLGGGAAESYVLSVYLDERSPSSAICELRVSEPLEPGSARVHKCSWSTAGAAGEHRVIAAVERTLPLESETGNNIAAVEVSVAPAGSGRPPTAALTSSTDSAAVGEVVTFDGGSSTDPDGRVVAWMFAFGDGSTTGWVDSPVVQHAYESPGNYTAALRVRDNSSLVSGNDASVCIAVEPPPNRPPVARVVSILPNPAEVGEEVRFVGDAWDEDGAVVAFCWSSDIDGGLSGEQSFSTSGLSVGAHRVTLLVRDDRGSWSSPVSRRLDVVEPPPNSPPRAVIERISPSPALVGEPVTLVGRGEDEDGRVVELSWSSSLDGALGTGEVLTTARLRAGEHRIQLRVRDDDGAWSPEATSRLEVRAYPEEERPNRPPKASLSVSPSSITAHGMVRLDGSMSTDPDGRVEEYCFDFGDGSELSWTIAPVVNHVYSSAGEYAVRLRVRDDDGAQSPWSPETVVSVKKPPAPPAPSKAFVPGPGPVLVLAAIALALSLSRRRSRSGGML